MTEKTMTLAEALSLKKSLKRKIDKRLMKLKLAYMAVDRSDIKDHQKYYDNYCKELRSVYQSLNTLRINYGILCGAISMANAKTKTELEDPNGNPYTISQLLAMQSDDISGEILKALDDGYSRARSKQAGHKDIVIIDPFIGVRDEISKRMEEFDESVKLAIQKANAKKKIKVTFVD